MADKTFATQQEFARSPSRTSNQTTPTQPTRTSSAPERTLSADEQRLQNQVNTFRSEVASIDARRSELMRQANNIRATETDPRRKRGGLKNIDRQLSQLNGRRKDLVKKLKNSNEALQRTQRGRPTTPAAVRAETDREVFKSRRDAAEPTPPPAKSDPGPSPFPRATGGTIGPLQAPVRNAPVLAASASLRAQGVARSSRSPDLRGSFSVTSQGQRVFVGRGDETPRELLNIARVQAQQGTLNRPSSVASGLPDLRRDRTLSRIAGTQTFRGKGLEVTIPKGGGTIGQQPTRDETSSDLGIPLGGLSGLTAMGLIQSTTPGQGRKRQERFTDRLGRRQAPQTLTLKEFQQSVLAVEKRQKDFFSSEGFQNIDDLSSALTGGYKNINPPPARLGDRIALLGTGELDPVFQRVPTRDRSFAGQVGENLVGGLLGGPIAIGGSTMNAIEKTGLTVGALIIPETRAQVGSELLRPFGVIEENEFSFLPGGTPITPIGASTLITAGAFTPLVAQSSSVKAAGRTSARTTLELLADRTGGIGGRGSAKQKASKVSRKSFNPRTGEISGRIRGPQIKAEGFKEIAFIAKQTPQGQQLTIIPKELRRFRNQGLGTPSKKIPRSQSTAGANRGARLPRAKSQRPSDVQYIVQRSFSSSSSSSTTTPPQMPNKAIQRQLGFSNEQLQLSKRQIRRSKGKQKAFSSQKNQGLAGDPANIGRRALDLRPSRQVRVNGQTIRIFEPEPLQQGGQLPGGFRQSKSEIISQSARRAELIRKNQASREAQRTSLIRQQSFEQLRSRSASKLGVLEAFQFGTAQITSPSLIQGQSQRQRSAIESILSTTQTSRLDTTQSSIISSGLAQSQASAQDTALDQTQILDQLFSTAKNPFSALPFSPTTTTPTPKQRVNKRTNPLSFPFDSLPRPRRTTPPKRGDDPPRDIGFPFPDLDLDEKKKGRKGRKGRRRRGVYAPDFSSLALGLSTSNKAPSLFTGFENRLVRRPKRRK